MKKKLSKILGYFNFEKIKNDKRIVVFLVCLFIASSLWFLNALSEDYTTTITYPVKYINPPSNQFLSNQPPSQLHLKVYAHGFTLLRNKLNFSFSPIILNLTNITQNIEPSSNGFRINTNSFIRQISDQVSSEITINNIQPEIFYVVLDSLKTKLVSLKTDFELSFKPQFNLKEPVILNPKQVEITGPAAVLDTIFFLNTEKRNIDKLDAEISLTLEIIHPENTTIKPEKTEVKIPVEKFTEKELVIPIQIKNNSDTFNIKLFPSEIKLAVLVGLSEFEEIDASKFEVFVDYKDIKAEAENLEITVHSKLPNVQIIRFIPASVEYLIETN